MESLLTNIWFIGSVVAIMTLLGIYFAIKGKTGAVIIALLITLIWFFITIIWRDKDFKNNEVERIKNEDMYNMTLARTNFNEGKYFPADTIYQKVSVSTQRYIQPEIERNKKCCNLIIEIGKDLDNGKPDQAKDDLIIIAKLNPQDQNISQQIEYCDSLIKQEKEKTTQPITTSETTTKTDNKQEAMAYNSKGLRYSAMGDDDKAIENYSIAINRYANYYQAYRNRSIQYENIGKYDIAFDDADKAVKIMGSGPNYEQRGDINCRLGKYSAAVEDYKKAIDYYTKMNTVEWYDGKKVTHEPTNDIKVQVLNKLKCAEEQKCFCY